MGIHVESCTKVDLKEIKIDSECKVYLIHVKVNEINLIAQELIQTISDTSWIKSLEIDLQMSYEARALPTIKKLVEGIFNKITDTVTSEFGEYVISQGAQIALVQSLNHRLIPLAELWKEKSKGNPGFDFHTESNQNNISFGEAKYNSNENPHRDAVSQIVGFIGDRKDEMDMVHLKNFTSKKAYKNMTNKKRAFAAAFSMKSAKDDYSKILSFPLNMTEIHELIKHEELFIIGVEIC